MVTSAGGPAADGPRSPGADDGTPLRVGVLAVQGGVREHVGMLRSLGAETVLVRRPADLAGLDAIVLPGGESTVIDRLTRILSLATPLRSAILDGLPTLGTCAGLILLADRLVDPGPGQHTLGVLDATVGRNAFGRQVVSSEETVQTELGPVRGAFIRAPEVVEVGPDVQILGRRGGDHGDPEGPVVAVVAGDVLGIAFHPELTGDTTIHAELLRRARARRDVAPHERGARG